MRVMEHEESVGRMLIRALIGTLVLGAVCAPRVSSSQSADTLPFFLGERLTYGVRIPDMRMSGTGAMWVDGPVDVRGTSTLQLHFDFSARLGPLKASNSTESWLDPRRMAALRFLKRERVPLGGSDEDVRLYPGEHRWVAAGGDSGASPSAAALDELSFIYFVRTLPLTSDSTYRFDRHFDARRDPVSVRVLGHESVMTPAGEFATIIVEMRVKDPRHYRGEGVLRLNLSDDGARIPVRIESRMPDAGRVVFTLATRTTRQTVAAASSR
jgi:hypothetical protein